MTDDPHNEAQDRHREMAIEANNAAWELLDGRSLEPDDEAELLARANAAAYHWQRAADATPVNQARAAWLLSRAHAVVGEAGLALRYAERCRQLTDDAGDGAADFDRAYVHEATARALAAAGRLDDASDERDRARAVVISDDEDRSIVESDLAAGPWFGLDD